MKNMLNIIAIAALTCGILILESLAIQVTNWPIIHMIVHIGLIIALAKYIWK